MSKYPNPLAELERIGAIIRNSHIQYTSGKHGSEYVNKDAVYPHTELTSRLCLRLAEQYLTEKVEVVVAPAIGAVILSQWIAFHLSRLTDKEVFSVYAEKLEGTEGFVLKRGYDQLVKGRRCLIVEDVLNTGGSVVKVIQEVKRHSGEIVGVAALCNRGGVTPESLSQAPKLVSLIDIKLEAWEPSECPLCKKGIPLNTNVGKAKK